MFVQKFIFHKDQAYCFAANRQLMAFFGFLPVDVYTLEMRSEGLYVLFLKTVEVDCAFNVVVNEG